MRITLPKTVNGQAPDETGDIVVELPVVPRRRATYFRNMIPISSRPAHGMSEQSNGTDIWGRSRVKQFATVDCSSLALSFRNYYDGNKLPTNDTITVNAAIEVNGTIYSLFFNGAATVNIAAGAGGIVTDPLGLTLKKGDAFFIHTGVSVVAGKSWPTMLTSRSADGEGSARGTTGSVPAFSTTITAVNERIYTAEAVLANVVSKDQEPINPVVVGTIGDSITWGLGETAPETDLGFIVRAINNNFPTVRFERAGGRLDQFLAFTGNTGCQRRLPMLDACSTLVCAFGVNDLNAGRTQMQIQTDFVTLWTWAQQRDIRVLQTTLTPWVTATTDSYVTAEGQTTATFNATRVAINAWIRGGAPIDPITRLPVAIGTSGALETGDEGHPLYDYIEVADVVESARDSGVWKAHATPSYYTADGIHPTSAGHALMAAAIDTTQFA